MNPLEYHHTDNFDEYIEGCYQRTEITFANYLFCLEIDMALTIIRSEHNCSTIIGYGHSIGALVLLNYIRSVCK